jgi:hypothetical protein
MSLKTTDLTMKRGWRQARLAKRPRTVLSLRGGCHARTHRAGSRSSAERHFATTGNGAVLIL